MKPQFYIQRDNGEMVPLIAVDELPDDIAIEGVSRTLTAESTTNMQFVGRYSSRPDKYNMHFTGSDRSESIRAMTNTQQTPNLYISNTPPFAQVASVPSKHQIPATQTASITHKPGLVPGQKKYCTYWLRKGECDYAQQGCMFKHEMPQDQETLNQLGFRDIPQWYRDQYRLGSFLASKGSGAAFNKTGTGTKNVVSDPSSSQASTNGPRGSSSRNQRGRGVRRVVGEQRAPPPPLVNLLDDDSIIDLTSPDEADTSATSISNGLSSEVPATILPEIPPLRVYSPTCFFDNEFEIIRQDEERRARDDARCGIVAPREGTGLAEGGARGGEDKEGGAGGKKGKGQRKPRHHARPRNRK